MHKAGRLSLYLYSVVRPGSTDSALNNPIQRAVSSAKPPASPTEAASAKHCGSSNGHENRKKDHVIGGALHC